MLQVAKYSTGAMVTVLGTAVVQYAYFDATYKPLSPPEGTTEGIVRRAAPKVLCDTSGQHRAEENSTLLQEKQMKAASPLPKSLRILFVGDSLIAGVGCTKGEAILPRQLAQSIANELNVEVSWRAWALIGGDVRQLQTQIIPEISKYMNAAAASGGADCHGVRVDAVVVMCGLNDWKRVLSGEKTPEVFYNDLASLVNALHYHFNPKCRVILPALPLHLTTAFPQPLFSFVLTLAEAWDMQKQRLAGEAVAAVDFVCCPPDFGNKGICVDGVHPNEDGYAMWAEHISLAIAEKLAGSSIVAQSKIK